MAATRNIDDVIDQIDVEEQQRLFLRMEQERKDREYAERLFQEQLETPPRPAAPRTPINGRDRGRGRGGAARRIGVGIPRRTRRNLATIGARAPAPEWFYRNGVSIPYEVTRNWPTINGRQVPPQSYINPQLSNGGGPIRNNTTAGTRARGGRQRGGARGRGRSTGRRNATNDSGLQFNGDRLQARQGDEVIDITDNAYFPDDADDSDYEFLDDGDDQEATSSGSGSSSDSEPEEEPVPHRRDVPSSLIRSLLSPNLMRDNARTDPNYQVVRTRQSDDSSESDSTEDIESDLSDESEDEVMDGHLHAEENNIEQGLFDEDLGMYNRELLLYHDDSEYQVPPARPPPKYKGKPIAPDSTWGDCTMCSNPPIKPQGCKQCLQFLGCADCIRRWYEARQGSIDRPSCPLCRHPWNNRGPAVQMMPTIVKNREKQNKPSTSGTSPPVSSAPSTSSAGAPSTSTTGPSSSSRPSTSRPSRPNRRRN